MLLGYYQAVVGDVGSNSRWFPAGSNCAGRGLLMPTSGVSGSSACPSPPRSRNFHQDIRTPWPGGGVLFQRFALPSSDDHQHCIGADGTRLHLSPAGNQPCSSRREHTGPSGTSARASRRWCIRTLVHRHSREHRQACAACSELAAPSKRLENGADYPSLGWSCHLGCHRGRLPSRAK